MTLSEAIKKSKRQIFLGWVISSSSAVLLLMSLMLWLFESLKNDTSSFLSILSQLVVAVIVLIYEKTQFLSVLWYFAPTFHYPNIFVEENLKFAAIVCAFILGIIMKGSGVYLSKRINKARQRAEETVWEKSLTGEVSSADTLKVPIHIEAKDSWYTRPSGVITMAVIGGYIVNVLSKVTGL